MHQMELRKNKLASKARITASLMERAPRSYLLGMVTQQCPENLTLYKFELETKLVKAKKKSKFDKKKVKTSKASAYTVELTLIGYARSTTDVDVGNYLMLLENSPLVLQANLESTKDLTDDKMTVREFEFKLLLDTKLDVIEIARGLGLGLEDVTLATGGSTAD